jgi:hypothetical protein
MSQEPMKLKHCLIIATTIIVMMLVAYQLAAIQAGPTNGTLTVAIKDAPVDLSHLEVTIDSLEVQSQDNGWINIPFIDGVQSVTFDLLSLQDVSQDLSTTQIPTGTYTKMRLHVSEAIATYNDATTENLNVPSDKIDVIIHFEVKDEATTSILIDMTADFVAISSTHNLRPVLKATQLPTPTPTVSPNPSILDASPT